MQNVRGLVSRIPILPGVLGRSYEEVGARWTSVASSSGLDLRGPGSIDRRVATVKRPRCSQEDLRNKTDVLSERLGKGDIRAVLVGGQPTAKAATPGPMMPRTCCAAKVRHADWGVEGAEREERNEGAFHHLDCSQLRIW